MIAAAEIIVKITSGLCDGGIRCDRIDNDFLKDCSIAGYGTLMVLAHSPIACVGSRNSVAVVKKLFGTVLFLKLDDKCLGSSVLCDLISREKFFYCN